MNENEILEFASQYEICDGHTHIFPDKIAQKASENIGKFYSLDMDNTSGTSEHLIEGGKKIGVTNYLVCSTATIPSQVVSINNFILEQCKLHPEFIGLGTIHPDYENVEEEIQRCIDNGLRGIKIHPDFQKFYIDEDKAYKIYEACAGRIPILIHMGDSRFDYSRPSRLESVVKRYPKLTAFAAHLGGYERWEEAATCLYYDNIMFDTSSSLEFISPEFARDIIHGFGVDKVFFGTDFPMWSHITELGRFMNLKLSDSENKKILSSNFKKQFDL